MTFKYAIRGIELSFNEMKDIHDYYEAACTAEFLMENYDIKDEEKALYLGCEVRWLMYKYDCDEETAIHEVLVKARRMGDI